MPVAYLIETGSGKLEDLEGNKFILKDSPFVLDTDFQESFEKIQPISVTSSFRKGQIWKNSSDEDEDKWVRTENGKSLTTRRHILTKVDKKDENILILEFNQDSKPIITLKNIQIEEDKAFKELVCELNLSKSKLLNLIKTMLVNTFLPETLEIMLHEEKIDFVMDNLWIYLKAEGKAYRV